MKKITNQNILASIRRSWGNVNPVQRAFKSKKTYNRRDKSWRKDFD